MYSSLKLKEEEKCYHQMLQWPVQRDALYGYHESNMRFVSLTLKIPGTPMGPVRRSTSS